jgi:NAD(P)-dependent dehydrogenase (short-subunit alcohol dehydrogenase family)
MPKNTVVCITGANSGIGLGMTRSLLQKGFNVAAMDLGDEKLLELKKIQPELLLIYKMDVTDDTAPVHAVNKIIEKWEKIDILVNNACLAIFAPFEEKNLSETRREFEVNYFGYIRMIKAVLPFMKSRNSGIIHNVSSGVGLTGFPGIYGYASTKGAIEALTLTLAMELKPYGIVVNTMHPPLTKTPSAIPLGIPEEVMEDPEIVGKKLASRIYSLKPAVTPGFQTRLYLNFCRRFPATVGRIMAGLTMKAKKKQTGRS